ncbi:GNAT family N-acetyltransferase [Hymenobacter ginsengisoli]|uniref:GNAT family N-acetyltransferase n=1 Tax=Hymenobacter ginsengisoli TaxID=1051626 RepID=A0ABP8PXY8_9BACT|nr:MULTISPECIES: GNAT family N-acetyltransferase [unclassified Hymenobacter]MBO2030476.1 GNAT family N-acetyltransferase [Hymenobacter sp. BT559]
MTTVEKVTDLRDLDAAFTIREKVFVGEQNVPADAEYDAHDRARTTRHYLARVDGQPAGAARWRPTENGVKLERFAVLPEFRNHGVGGALVHRVLADVRAEAPDAAQVYLHAQLRAIPLYERTGFRKEGDMFEECDIQHYKMVLG